MFRYLQASNSQAEGLAAVQPDFLKLSAQAVVVQEQAINERLVLAEDRLRAIASASRSPLPVIRELKYQSIERAPRPQKPNLHLHLQQISKHLKQIELCWQSRQSTSERQYQLMYLESVQRYRELEISHSRQVMRLENLLKQQEEEKQLHIREIQAKQNAETAKLRNDHEQSLQHILKERREELRAQHLDTESKFLAREHQLITEIELLEGTLDGELEQHARTQAKLNDVEQHHIKEICRLQTRVENLQSQLKRATQELQLERSLKVDCLNQLREQAGCLDIARLNNQRFSKEVNQLKGQLADSLSEVTEAYSYLDRTLTRLSSIADKSKTSAVLHVFRQLLESKVQVLSRIEQVRLRYSAVQSVTHEHKRSPPTDRLSTLISTDKENSQYQGNISADFAGRRLYRKTRSALYQPIQKSTPRLPLKEVDTYQFLLVQAQQIQSFL